MLLITRRTMEREVWRKRKEMDTIMGEGGSRASSTGWLVNHCQ